MIGRAALRLRTARKHAIRRAVRRRDAVAQAMQQMMAAPEIVAVAFDDGATKH